MSGYGQFCPVAKGAELFAERWTPLILRELINGSTRFSEIRAGCPRIPHSLLTQRLRSLERAGVVERHPVGRASEYRLTRSGQELGAVVEALGAWGYRWAGAELAEDDLDPAALMWFWRFHLRREGTPGDRMVIEVEFTDVRRRFWLIARSGDVDLCLKPPGFEPDVAVRGETRWLAEVYLARRTLANAIGAGLVEVDGSRRAVRELPRWLRTTSFAQYGRPAEAGTTP